MDKMKKKLALVKNYLAFSLVSVFRMRLSFKLESVVNQQWFEYIYLFYTYVFLSYIKTMNIEINHI